LFRQVGLFLFGSYGKYTRVPLWRRKNGGAGQMRPRGVTSSRHTLEFHSGSFYYNHPKMLDHFKSNQLWARNRFRFNARRSRQRFAMNDKNAVGGFLVSAARTN
jgi:glycogen debranching enzyme